MSTVVILADFVSEKATKSTVEIATAGAVIGEVTALVLAPVGKGAAYAASINQGPVTKVLVIESEDFTKHGVAACADELAYVIGQSAPSAVLVVSNAFGKEVAVRVAMKKVVLTLSQLFQWDQSAQLKLFVKPYLWVQMMRF